MGNHGKERKRYHQNFWSSRGIKKKRKEELAKKGEGGVLLVLARWEVADEVRRELNRSVSGKIKERRSPFVIITFIEGEKLSLMGRYRGWGPSSREESRVKELTRFYWGRGGENSKKKK